MNAHDFVDTVPVRATEPRGYHRPDPRRTWWPFVRGFLRITLGTFAAVSAGYVIAHGAALLFGG